MAAYQQFFKKIMVCLSVSVLFVGFMLHRRADGTVCREGKIAPVMLISNRYLFKWRMPKFHHLRDFVAIARADSVRSAARTLGLTQPALTRSLRELELEIGGVLCERHARGIVLTPLGERFLVRAQASLEELRRGRMLAELRRLFRLNWLLALSYSGHAQLLSGSRSLRESARRDIHESSTHRLAERIARLLADTLIPWQSSP